MWGVIYHVSAPTSRTAYTTTFKKIPDTLGLAPSPPIKIHRQDQIFQASHKTPTTDGQYLSKAVKIHPKYLKYLTVSSGLL